MGAVILLLGNLMADKKFRNQNNIQLTAHGSRLMAHGFESSMVNGQW
jgi:hypothetical protein